MLYNFPEQSARLPESVFGYTDTNGRMPKPEQSYGFMGSEAEGRKTFASMLEDFKDAPARPAALGELRQAAEILENMDGPGGLGDETKFMRLMSEALFMFDLEARKRMLTWLNSACG